MGKLTSVTYLRAFCMLYIVGYWHLFDYASVSFGHNHPVMEELTHVILAIFVFISGFFLGGRKSQAMSVAAFYRKRLLRIYPLYAIAVLLFYIYGINDGWVTVRALLGISMYSTPAPLTLWFITMLLLFYLITPLLLVLVKRVFVYALAGFLLFTGTLVAKFVFTSVDERVLMYFPSFFLGIFCANHGLDNRFMNMKVGFAAVVAGVALLFVETGYTIIDELREIPLLTGGAYLIFAFARRYEEKFGDHSVVEFFCYSGFAMYLFHRPIFTTMEALYFPVNPVLQIAYLLVICLPIVALFSYTMQRLYDLLGDTVRARFHPVNATVKT